MENDQDSLLSLEELLKAVKGRLLNFTENAHKKNFCFTSVVIDSRNVCENALFVPLLGEKQDGHAYVKDSFFKGASVIFVCESSLVKYKDDYQEISSLGCYIIVVEDSKRALQHAACAYIKQFPLLKKIGITGSSGKTTTKELIAVLLSQKYSVVMTQGNFNSETGLPLSVFSIREEHEIGVFELGMNRTGEIKELTDVLFPDIAVITNIGTAHIGILGSKDAIAHEKKQIFSNFNKSSVGFIPSCDEYASFLKENVLGSFISYGKDVTNGIDSVVLSGLLGTDFNYYGIPIHFVLPGKYNFNDLCAAISVAQYYKLSTPQIVRGIECVKPLFGRSEIIKSLVTIVQDCYNANKESMLQSIKTADETVILGKKIYIIGDMLELGESSFQSHKDVVLKLICSDAKCIVFVGTEFCSVYDALKKEFGTIDKEIMKVPFYDDASLISFFESFSKKLKKDDILLLKGSRGIRLERFTSYVKALEKKVDYRG